MERTEERAGGGMREGEAQGDQTRQRRGRKSREEQGTGERQGSRGREDMMRNGGPRAGEKQEVLPGHGKSLSCMLTYFCWVDLFAAKATVETARCLAETQTQEQTNWEPSTASAFKVLV